MASKSNLIEFLYKTKNISFHQSQLYFSFVADTGKAFADKRLQEIKTIFRNSDLDIYDVRFLLTQQGTEVAFHV